MGQEKEIPSGGRCSRGDYGSAQETFLTFSRSLVGLFKESSLPFQGIQSSFSRGFSVLAGALMTFTRGFSVLAGDLLNATDVAASFEGSGEEFVHDAVSFAVGEETSWHH